MGKHSNYGVILDAGSSGTRVYVYKWKDPAYAQIDASATELQSLPKLKLEKSKKIHPGVSTFAEDVDSVGPDHLQELIEVALDEVPDDKISETPIFLLATAGVRLLQIQQQTELLGGICSWLQENTQFLLPDCNRHIQVIPGETEGLYGWIAANYLLGGFDHPEGEDQGLDQSHHHTYGFLDMGGASAQIAFAPNATEAEKHADDLKLVRMRQLDGKPAVYKVFTTTWLGFGANQARDRYVESLQTHYDADADEIPDPCMPRGLRTNLEGELDESGTSIPTLVGTGKFDECLSKTYPLLGKDEPCEDEPCLLNGQHVPLIDFNINRFVGVSEFWHTTHGVFGGKNKAYDLETYQHEVVDYCRRDWSDIEDDLDKRKKDPERKAQDAREACFKASWLINMLYEGIGIPRVGLESGFNSTLDQEDPFRPVNKIDDVELSWTLGKMVLYAAGQVPPEGRPLPVGFGPNNPGATKSGLFEEVGSVPSTHVAGDDDDDDDLIRTPSNQTSALLVVILLLVVAGYLLRRPERRRKLWNLARGRRKSGSGRKPARGFSLANKLFGRNPHTYERVMEEGEAMQFELDGVDSDDNSDSSEGSRGARRSPTPKDSNDDMLHPSAFDRQGLAVRTESRERLTTLGRRSRAGSPQRQKSSLMTPMEQD